MNTSVNFELAKSLKEKGYPFEFITVGEIKEVPLNIPTISDVVMWLYEKHGVWIEVYLDDDTTFGYLISEVTNEGRVDSPLQRGFTSPTEAYERGIKWILQNRI